MKNKVRFLGLDVHAETIAVAIAEPEWRVRSLGTMPTGAESVRKLVKKLGPAEHLKACYEAGPTGYVLYWQLAELGVACEVIAPTLVPNERPATGEDGSTRCRAAGRAVIGPATSRQFGFRTRDPRRCATWCGRARRPKQDQLRARHRLGQVFVAHGAAARSGDEGVDGPLHGLGAAGSLYTVAREATMLDYLYEVDHMGERVKRLEQSITEAVSWLRPQCRRWSRACRLCAGSRRFRR